MMKRYHNNNSTYYLRKKKEPETKLKYQLFCSLHCLHANGFSIAMYWETKNNTACTGVEIFFYKLQPYTKIN